MSKRGWHEEVIVILVRGDMRSFESCLDQAHDGFFRRGVLRLGVFYDLWFDGYRNVKAHDSLSSIYIVAFCLSCHLEGI